MEMTKSTRSEKAIIANALKKLEALPKELRRYVENATAQIGSKRRRQEAIVEIVVHIEEILAELHASENQVQEVLSRLGDASQLAPQLAEANRTPLRQILWRGFGALTLLVAAGLAIGFVLLTWYLDNWERDLHAKLNARWSNYVMLQEKYSNHPFFAPPINDRDAGRVLEKIDLWSELPVGWSQEMVDQVGRAQGNLKIEELLAINLHHIDLTWMSELKNYGRWDSFGGERGKQELAKAQLAGSPMPKWINVITLLKAARLRFVEGLQTQNVRAALDDIESLARLLVDNNTIIDYGIAVTIRFGSLPRWEKLAIESGFLKDKPRYQEEVPFNDLRSLTGVPTAALEGADLDKMREILNHPEWRIGRCAAMAEMELTSHIAEPALRSSPWPLESDNSEYYTLRDKAQKQDVCGSVYPRLYDFTHMKTYFPNDPSSFYKSWINETLIHVPFLRRVIGRLSMKALQVNILP